MIKDSPELLLIACEGKTEVMYFKILQRTFRLPTWVKVIPDLDKGQYKSLGQHEALFFNASQQRDLYAKELDIEKINIETWAVCDRDNYKGSYIELEKKALEINIQLAFSDPQFENYLLQHFSPNKSKLSGKAVEEELSQHIAKIQSRDSLYKKNDLTWLKNLIDHKHSIIRTATKNANIYSNHTKQPFFTVQKLVERLLTFVQ